MAQAQSLSEHTVSTKCVHNPPGRAPYSASNLEDVDLQTKDVNKHAQLQTSSDSAQITKDTDPKYTDPKYTDLQDTDSGLRHGFSGIRIICTYRLDHSSS